MCFLHSICGALGLLVTSVKFLLSSGMLLAQKTTSAGRVGMRKVSVHSLCGWPLLHTVAASIQRPHREPQAPISGLEKVSFLSKKWETAAKILII